MVEIPNGQIVLRDDRIKKSWSVDIESFFLAKYPISQESYFEITGDSPSTFKGDLKPVETISWKEAILFCNLLSKKMKLNPCYAFQNRSEVIEFDKNANGFRLPTEAEWEYACKAGMSEARNDELDKIAWYKENSGGETKDIGLKMPNSWGLYDMLGNVWEWCSDIYDETVYGSYRIMRGGGWNDDERGCLATNRRRSHPTSFKIDDLGFRIARNK
ncbi:MAG: SUMF1/EgtB/PvdO family nonheme iron enzyme [Bacteroidetes bacterium]|nr:SUMF1/EgtB/PvdO family nonheme iron enzyme [Bacteroidota bacterium]